MTQVDVIVSGVVSFSSHVQRVQINKEAQNGVGTWELVLDPWPNNYHGSFTAGDDISISIDSVKMLGGYLDDPKFYYDGGVDTELLRLMGLDYGFDLANLYVSKKYDNQNYRADDIIEDALTLESSEIVYISPGTAPYLNYDFDRTFLTDGFKEIANNVDYDFYPEVTKVAGQVPLQFFDIGNAFQHSAVELRSVSDETTNNILWWDKGDGLGSEMKNYVEAVAGPLDDHWTEMNASDFVGTNCTIYDLLSHGTVEPYLFGRASIFARNETGGLAVMSIELDFSGGLYEYTSLDMRKDSTGFYSYVIHNTNVISKTLRIRLWDIYGQAIEYYHSGLIGGLGKCYDCTDQPDNDEWRWVNFPLGEESGIENALVPASTKGHWYQFIGGGFDWEQVEKIEFETTGDNMNDGDWFIIDGLRLPNVEVKSISQSAASIALHKKRMKPYYRPDIKSQMELDQFAEYTRARYQWPYYTLDVHALGQTGSVYPGQTLNVLIPNSEIHGANTSTPLVYRITNLEHVVVKDTSESEYPGVDFVTKYELVLSEVDGAFQKVDIYRLLRGKSPVRGRVRENIRSIRWSGTTVNER